jgi:hypothetical protein
LALHGSAPVYPVDVIDRMANIPEIHRVARPWASADEMHPIVPIVWHFPGSDPDQLR